MLNRKDEPPTGEQCPKDLRTERREIGDIVQHQACNHEVKGGAGIAPILDRMLDDLAGCAT